MNKPKGYLVAVGGAENKGDNNIPEQEKNFLNNFEEGVLSKILHLADKGHEPIVEVVTSASSIPSEMAAIYKKAFEKLGCIKVGHLDISRRKDTEKSDILNRLVSCNIIMFSGGDQLRLSSIFGGTEFLDIIRQRYYDEHFIIAGSSAGAMAMSNTMIHGGKAAQAHLKGEVKMSIGFGFIQNVIIDTHFDKRGRFNRLAQAVATQPGIIGIGLGEDTGMIVKNGTELEAVGSGSITIIDGKNISYNNIADIDVGFPISLENLKVHIMSRNDIYDIDSRTLQTNDLKRIRNNWENYN